MCFKFDSSIKTIYFVKKFVLLKYFCIGTKFRYLYKNLNASLLKVFVFKLVTLFAGSNWIPIISSIVLCIWIKFSLFLPQSLLLWVSRCFLMASVCCRDRIPVSVFEFGSVVDCSILSDRCLQFLLLYFELFISSLFLPQVHSFFVAFHHR